MADSTYVPPAGNSAALTFTDAGYTPPTGNKVALEFAQSGGGTSDIRYVFPEGLDPVGFGDHATSTARLVAPASIDLSYALGSSSVRNQQRFVVPGGIAPLIWNRTNSGLIQLWIQPVTPTGINSFATASPRVVNTTATQLVTGAGAGAQSWYGTAAVVGARSITVPSLPVAAYGTPRVQSMPKLAGWDSSSVGLPTVRDNHQEVYPVGYDASTVAMPDARIWQQFVFAPSLLETGLMGDTLVRLQRRYVSPPTVDDGFISPFGLVENRNRVLIPQPIAAAPFGVTTAANKSPNLTPTGFAGEIGTHGVGFYFRTVKPTGALTTVYGTTKVANAARSIAPAGLTGAFGALAATHYVREITKVGAIPTPTQDQNATVDFLVRYVRNAGGKDMALYGATRLENSIRRVEMRSLGDTSVFGPGRVSFVVRSVAPSGIGFLTGKQFGAVAVKDAKQTVAPWGADFSRVGEPTTYRNEQVVTPRGFAGETGEPDADLFVRYLAARSFASEQTFGQALVFNSDQYVLQIWTPDSVIELGGVGIPWEVANRTRTISTFGTDMSKFAASTILVDNAARLVAPDGLGATQFGGAFASASVRSVAPEGFSTYLAGGAIAYNNSRMLEPSGFRGGVAGVPSILDRTQRLDAVGGIPDAPVPAPMVAFRIRYVDQNIWGIEPPRNINVEVGLYTRYLRPPGIAGAFGAHTLETHRNLITPRSADMSRYGEGLVKNVTPELAAYGADSSEFGRATAFNWQRTVSASAVPAGAMGAGTVTFRTRYVAPGGVETLRIPTHDVMFDAPQLPAQQLVAPKPTLPPGGVDGAAYFPQIGTAVFELRGAIVLGKQYTTFGTASVTNTAIGPCFILYVDTVMFGTPTLNGPQTVTVPTIEPKYRNSTDDALGFGKEFIGEPTITPLNVVLKGGDQVIDYDQIWSDRRPKWGTAGITLGKRTVTTRTDRTMLAMGEPGVSLRVRTIAPASMVLFRYGIPSLPVEGKVYPFWGRDTEDELPGVNIDPCEYGVAKVAFPEVLHRTLRMTGMAGALGRPEVQNQHRTLTITAGVNSLATGRPSVGPPPKVLPKGFGSSAFGALITGYYFQFVQVDSTDMEGAIGPVFDGGMHKPMTVRLRTSLYPAGFDSTAFGLAYAGNRVRSIEPVAITGEVPTPVVSSTATIRVEGFSSMVMGTPKQPVYGTIEPAGFESSTHGVGVLDRVIHAPYIERGVLGTPRIKSRVEVTGMDTLFGDTVVVGESNCGSTLAVVAKINATSTFGQPGVHR